MSTDKQKICSKVLSEGWYLDNKNWDAWLDLYTEDSVFWMPMWKNENELNSDPYLELSFIFLAGKPKLQERVNRVVSGLSVASKPMPRTCHMINVVDVASTDAGVRANSVWSSHIYNHKTHLITSYYGQYEHLFVAAGDDFLIKEKKITVINDYLASNLEFYFI